MSWWEASYPAFPVTTSKFAGVVGGSLKPLEPLRERLGQACAGGTGSPRRAGQSAECGAGLHTEPGSTQTRGRCAAPGPGFPAADLHQLGRKGGCQGHRLAWLLAWSAQAAALR